MKIIMLGAPGAAEGTAPNNDDGVVDADFTEV